jgi:translation initiation factor 4E
MKRILSFPPETKVEWKSHDSSIQQRSAIDDARKEKSGQHNHHSANQRNGSKDTEHSFSFSDKKQIS